MEILVFGLLVIVVSAVIYARRGDRGVPYGRGRRDAGDGDRGGWVGGNLGSGGDNFGSGGGSA